MYAEECYCPFCQKETTHHDMKCTACAAKERQGFIALWGTLSVESRLNDLRERIEVLERNNRC